MENNRATALPDYPTLPQAEDSLNSKLTWPAETTVSSKQRVAGSNPARDAISYESAPFHCPTELNRAAFNAAAQ